MSEVSIFIGIIYTFGLVIVMANQGSKEKEEGRNDIKAGSDMTERYAL